MGHGKNDSSESDEDNIVRHDRFKSERFKDSYSNALITGSKSREYSYSKHSSKKYRERSPPISRSRLEKSESSQRKESKNKYDDREYRSKSNKYEKRDLKNQLPSQSQRKHSDEYKNYKERDDSNSGKTSSKKLSSILMNFDKKIESKRLNSESLTQVGPTLPSQLARKVEEEEELSSVESVINRPISVGPSLPPYVKHSNKDTNEESGSDVVTNQSNNVIKNDIKSSNIYESIDQLVECGTLFTMGPALPPHLLNQQITSIKEPEEKLHTSVKEPEEKLHTRVKEPEEKLHNNVKKPEENLQKDIEQKVNLSSPVQEADEKLEVFGPVLPPTLEEDNYGPALPPNFKKHAVQGPSLPSGMTSDDLEKMAEDESEDEDTFGPLPVGKMNLTQYQLELRAMDIKRKLDEEKSGSSKDIKKREEWMLELPPEKASNLGLGPRSFRMKAGPDMSNRSAWTDTPAEKKRKEEMALRGETEPVNSEEVMRTAFVKERNETMDQISKFSQDEEREKSLLEMHQKKLKKKKKKEEKEGKKKERRPFDRNIDLQVHRFDEAQKKAIYKKAQLLDTRFSTGESKYL